MKTLKLGSRGQDVVTLQRSLNLITDGIFGKITDEAVRQFQKERNLQPDGIVGPKTWSALGQTSTPCSRRINKIIIHCAATPEGKHFTVDNIRKWHLDRGFSDVGYHYVIYLDGSVHEGRPLDKVGAHCSGYNTNSIGICYIGGVENNESKRPKDTRTSAQKTSLESLLRKLRKRFPNATIHGHNEFANKACPSFNVKLSGLCDI